EPPQTMSARWPPLLFPLGKPNGAGDAVIAESQIVAAILPVTNSSDTFVSEVLMNGAAAVRIR
ncbi:MAG: hypothetical protein AAGK78_14780, partial [Planctomycetota bacterium]